MRGQRPEIGERGVGSGDFHRKGAKVAKGRKGKMGDGDGGLVQLVAVPALL